MSDTEMQSTPAQGPTVGQTLKAKREERGWPLEQVAEQLKLNNRQLQAIEEDDFEALPGNTFARGFVRNYARLLELDPQPLLDQLTALLPKERIQTALPHVSDATALNAALPIGRPSRKFSVGIMVVVGLLLGAGTVFWYLQQPPSPDMALSDLSSKGEAAFALQASGIAELNASDVITQAESDASSVSMISILPLTSVASEASAVVAVVNPVVASSPAAAGSADVRLVAEFDSWVQVVDADGQILISQLLKQGMDRSLTGKAPFKIKIGNAPKTQLYYHGQRIDLAPHSRADVATLELK